MNFDEFNKAWEDRLAHYSSICKSALAEERPRRAVQSESLNELARRIHMPGPETWRFDETVLLMAHVMRWDEHLRKNHRARELKATRKRVYSIDHWRDLHEAFSYLQDALSCLSLAERAKFTDHLREADIEPAVAEKSLSAMLEVARCLAETEIERPEPPTLPAHFCSVGEHLRFVDPPNRPREPKGELQHSLGLIMACAGYELAPAARVIAEVLHASNVTAEQVSKLERSTREKLSRRGYPQL